MFPTKSLFSLFPCGLGAADDPIGPRLKKRDEFSGVNFSSGFKCFSRDLTGMPDCPNRFDIECPDINFTQN
jgi:hypothetical protein